MKWDWQPNRLASALVSLASKLKGGGVIINEHTLGQKEMRLHIHALSQNFDFIHLHELPRRLDQPRKRPFCLLTFDDGKRSNFSAAAPELERLGVPAVFYVTTEFLTQGTALWFDRQKTLVQALGFCPAGLELKTLKSLPHNTLNKRLEEACARYGITPGITSDNIRPMSWDEARSLSRRGFVIGAHGCTHATLTSETIKNACSEIERSLSTVSSKIGVPCTTFAFPNGNHTPALAQHALRCGASTVMTTDPVWVNCRSLLWRLPRIQLFGHFSPARISLKVALAALPGILANPDGSGRAYRRRGREKAPLPRADESPAFNTNLRNILPLPSDERGQG